MTEAALVSVEPSRRLHFDWVSAVLFRPRQAFARIAAQASGVWLTPILILTLVALVPVFVGGSIKQEAARSGQVNLPPDYQYYTPEQQAQFQQAMAATSGPVFVYVFPAITAILKIWLGWLLVGGLLHLVLTLLGGRGSTGTAMNLVAWSSLPFAVRELVHAGWMLSSHQLISSPGLKGFAPLGDGSLNLFLAALLALIDFYILWHLALLIVGVRAGNGLSAGKAVGGVLFTLLVVLLLQALMTFLVARLGGLTVIRPFF
jgi:hypothetical protein